MSSVPFNDLWRINIRLKPLYEEALGGFLNRGNYILGEKVTEFEHAYARFSDARYCVGVSSGYDALVLSLKALEIGEKDEVIMPSNAHVATVLAVLNVGATPVFAEPHEETFNLSAEEAEKKITRQTKVILPVHFFGLACELDELNQLAEQRGIYLVEDNAQSHGSSCKGIKTGSCGIINATSFYPTKNLGALGDAGAVTTQNKELSEKARHLRNYGYGEKNHLLEKGQNARLDEIQAAFLLKKLDFMNEFDQQRQTIASFYLSSLGDLPGLDLPVVPEGYRHVWHLFLVKTTQRDDLKNFLAEKRVETLIHYPVPPHLQPALRQLGYKKGSFPVAERLSETSLSLPIFPGMTSTETEKVVNSIRKFYGR